MPSATLTDCIHQISAIATHLQQIPQEAVTVELQQCLEILKRAEITLHSEQEFRALVENLSDPVARLDRESRILYINPVVTNITGLLPEHFIGKTSRELEMREDCVRLWEAAIQQVFETKQEVSIEFEYAGIQGIAYFQTRYVPELNLVGEVEAVLAISRDITELKQTQAQLQETHKLLEAVLGDREQAEQHLTPRKQAEEELRTSQHFIQKIADASPNLLYLYDLEERRNVYVNREITQMLGYTPEEVQAMGKDFFPTLMHPDDLLLCHGKYKQIAAARDGEVIEFEYRMRHKNGTWRWLYSWDTVFTRNSEGKPTQILGTATDISDRKQLELALQQSEERFRTCVENLLNPLALFSSIRDATDQIVDFRYEYINPAGCVANQRSREETLGTTVCELWPAHRETGIFDAYSQVVETGESLIQESVFFEDIYAGKSRPGFFDFQAVKLGDGLMVTWRDVTERKRAQEQIQASLQEKEVLLKEIHHRVKNNLQVILSLLKLQSSYTDDAKTLQMFQESQNRIRSMALIHELLYQSQDLARIDFGSYIHTLAHQLARTYTLSMGAISWVIEVEPSVIQLTMDTALPCGLVINELVSNALKYAFPTGQPGTIRIRLQACNDGEFILLISDNGVGISNDFDFRHTDSLGLQLVCGTTAQLGGTIELDRTQGTTFTIRFKEVKYKSRR